MERNKIIKIEMSVEDIKCLKDFKTNSVSGDSEKYLNIVVDKPWGYEYILFQNHEVSIWLLHIQKNCSTSMHCHPNKKTSLLVLSGKAICSTLNQKINLEEQEGIIINEKVFHSTESISEGGVFLIEIETPVNKEDLFRLKDLYKREGESYAGKSNISRELQRYPYYFIEDEIGKTEIFGRYNAIVREYLDEISFLEEIKETKYGVGILLSGKIKNNEKNISAGDIFNPKEIENPEIDLKARILFLENRS